MEKENVLVLKASSKPAMNKAHVYLVENLQSVDITFAIHDTEILKLCSNGDIYVKGKLIENDKEVVTGLREFLKLAKI